MANYKRFRSLVQETAEVNKQVCEARPVEALAADQPLAATEGKEQGSSRSSKRSSQPR